MDISVFFLVFVDIFLGWVEVLFIKKEIVVVVVKMFVERYYIEGLIIFIVGF